MSKILSVCVPTYNMEALLARCLDSFVLDKESMDMLEIIVVNDGSKDNSLQIMQDYAQKYPSTFVVVDKPNGNYGSCVNAALKVATGKYFRICDADDCYDRNILPEFISLLDKSTADIVFSPFSIYNFDYTFYSSMVKANIPENQIFSIDDIEWGNDVYSKYRAMHCMTVKRENLVKNHYYQTEGISYTDTEFVFYSILYSETCAFFSKVIYHYFLGRDGQTMSAASMLKSYMHFYKNARVMLDTYMTLPNTISENKRILLYISIFTCANYFASVILTEIKDSQQQLRLIDELVNDAKSCALLCPLHESFMLTRPYRLWKKYNMPQTFIYWFYRFKKFFSKN